MKGFLLRYGLTAAIGAFVAFLIMIGKGIFAAADSIEVLHILCDAFFVPGALLVCAGLLIFVSNGGVFDMLAYGVMLVFDGLRRDVTKRKYRTFYDYRESRKGKKREMGFILIVGLVYIAVACGCLIAYIQ